MKVHIANAAYGVLDYAAYPIGMLLIAPVLLHRLGEAQYGIWMITTAAVSIGSIIASGFGDANIQYVASLRSVGDHNALVRAVRCMMGINLLLGAGLALLSWMIVPFVVKRVAPANSDLQLACLWSLRIASILMPIRAIESVCISTQRAFERYGVAVRTSVNVRLLTLAMAVVLTWCHKGVISIMLATALFMFFGTWFQLITLKQHLIADALFPAFDQEAMNVLTGLGAFTWLLAISGVVFAQADRLILGVSEGASAVTSYALCVQMAQPIYGLAASGLHFLFPYLAGRHAIVPAQALRKVVLSAFVVNLLIVSAGAALLLVFGRRILDVWVGEPIARSAGLILTSIVLGSCLLGLSVTASYALLALGLVRLVTWLNLAGGLTMLLVMFCFLPKLGVYGLAMGRLTYGLITLLMYYPLIRRLRSKPDPSLTTSATMSAYENL